MSKSIDEQIVSVKLENTQFQRGVQNVLDGLARLKGALSFKGADKGFSDLNAASKNVKLDHISTSLDTIKNKFQTLSVAGIAALGALATKAVHWGMSMASNMFDPIRDGFAEYELKMGSIQTILANTARHGTDLQDVSGALDDLNKYADKTIYNFAEMTRNIGLFTNSGMTLEAATTSIQGFSNAAAASGTSAQGAAGAAYQLSQAMSAGTIRLMDWRSLTNVGMGGKNMQEGIINIADAMGTFSNGSATAKSAAKDFNGSLEEMWLTADVMSKYLEIMSNDNRDLAYEQARSIGLSKEQANTLADQAVTAFEAATKVRTLTQLMDTLAEANASGWTETAEIIIGDFDEATELFTAISDTLGGFISRGAENRNRILGDWKEMGGRDDIIQGFVNIYQAFENFIQPIAKAWNETFGVVAEGAEIFERPISRISYVLKALTQGFETFTEKLKMGELGMAAITAVFKAVFGTMKAVGSVISTVFGAVIAVVAGVVKYFLNLGMILVPLVKAVGNLAEGVSMLISRFFQWSGVTGIIKSVFDALIQARDNVLAPLINTLAIVVNAFGNLAKFGNKEAFLGEMKKALDSLDGPLEGIRQNIENFLGSVSKGAGVVSGFFKKMSSPALQQASVWIAAIAEGISILKDRLSGFKIDFSFPGFKKAADDVEVVTQSTSNLQKVGEALDLVFTALFKAIGPIFEDLAEIVTVSIDKIKDYLKDLDFQDAVALLNTGVFITMYLMIRSFFKKLKGLVGSAGDMFSSFQEMADKVAGAFDTIRGAVKTWQQDVKANIILKIAIAMGILAAALWVIAKIDADALKKSLVALGVMFAQMIVTVGLISKIPAVEGPKIIAIAATLVLLGLALVIIAQAVEDLAKLEWEELTKGLIGVSVLLAGLMLFTKMAQLDKGGIKTGVGLILLAISLRLLAGAVEKFGTMDVDTLKQGLLAITALLVMLGAVSRLMSGSNLLVGAAAMLVLAASLMALYGIIILYASLNVETLALGLIKMAAALAVIALAMTAMPKDMAKSSASLLLVAGAMAVLAGVLMILSTMGWESIAKGLVAMGGALIVIAVAMKLMTGALSGAFALMVVTAALYLLVPLLITLGSLPWEVVLLGLGALAGVFLVLGLAGLILAPVVPVIILLAAAIALLGVAMLAAGIGMFAFTAGFALLITAITAAVALGTAAFISFMNLIPLFAQQIGLGLIAFAKVISDAGPVIIGALTVVLISILRAIRNIIPEAVLLIQDLVVGMIAMLMGLTPRLAEAGLKMLTRLLEIIRDNIDPIIDTAADIVEKFIRGLERNTPRLVDAGVDLIVEFIESLAESLSNNEERLNKAGQDLAGSIVGGMVNGIWGGVKQIGDAARGVAKSALDGAMKFLGINSPSKEFFKIGMWSDEGMALGFKKNSDVVSKASENVGMSAINAMKKTISRLPDLADIPMDMEPRITPVLDLSDVESGVRKLDPMLAGRKISVDTSYDGALVASNAYAKSRDVREEIELERQSEPREIKFEQNNHSPKALSEAEIYRQTNNLLSRAKRELEGVE